MEIIWHRESLNVRQKRKRVWLWCNDGLRVRLRPEHQNYVWSYDFVSMFTHDGRTVRVLELIDEDTCEWMAIHVQFGSTVPI